MRLQSIKSSIVALGIAAAALLPTQAAYAESPPERYARIACSDDKWQINGFPSYGACYEYYYQEYVDTYCGGDPNAC